jgi:hypothetical protein
MMPTNPAMADEAPNRIRVEYEPPKDPAYLVATSDLFCLKLLMVAWLDITNVESLLEQVCRKRVTKRMRADPLGDACGCCRLVEDAAQLAVSNVLPLPTTRE